MNELFDTIYVINLESNVDRLKSFDSMMKKFNWNYQRHLAIDGKKITENLNRLKEKYIRKFSLLSPGEIGCLLSHVLLWEEVANNPSKKRILIFEDDARTYAEGKTIENILLNFYSYLKSHSILEPEMLYLGKALDDCLSYEKVWENIYKTKHPLCLHAYIINKHGAQKLLKLTPYNVPIDLVPIKAIKDKIINVMTFHPSLFYQDVFNNVSNLRSFKHAISNTVECSSCHYISEEVWIILISVFIVLVCTILLFIFI